MIPWSTATYWHSVIDIHTSGSLSASLSCMFSYDPGTIQKLLQRAMNVLLLNDRAPADSCFQSGYGESDSVEPDSSCSWLVSSDNWLFLHTEQWSGCQSLWSLSPYLPLHCHKARFPTVVPCSPLMHFLDNAWRELAELECTVTSALLRIRYSLLNMIETKGAYYTEDNIGLVFIR